MRIIVINNRLLMKPLSRLSICMQYFSIWHVVGSCSQANTKLMEEKDRAEKEVQRMSQLYSGLKKKAKAQGSTAGSQ